MKNEVIADLTHEMRSRMNAILGWAQLLKSGRISADQIHGAAEIIARNAVAQAKALDTLLDVNQVLAGKLKLELHLVYLQTVVDAVIKTLRPQLLKKNIRFKKELSVDAPPVHGDPARLNLAVTHLLSNTIRLTPEGGGITVEVAAVDSHVRLAVSHSPGDAQPKDMLDLAAPVTDDPELEPGGAGFGFVIVKHLVNLHGGKFQILNRGEVKGDYQATFPIADLRTSAPESSGDDWPDVDLSGRKILVVEDDPDSRTMLAVVLEGNGALVTTADCGNDACDLIRENSFDVIVSDIGLPDISGLELIRTVRAAGCDIPSIALTAYTSSADRKSALDAGFDMFVSKPVEAMELLRIVQRCLS